MKQIFTVIALFFTYMVAYGQQPQTLTFPVCWASSNGDSSLTQVVLYSARTPNSVKILAYLNGSGEVVDISAGGALSPGFCDCCGLASGNGGDDDWRFILNKTYENPVYRLGKTSIGTVDTSYQLGLTGTWQFRPDANSFWDWQSSSDTTGTDYVGLLWRAPATLSGTGTLNGGSNNISIGTSSTMFDRTRLGAIGFLGNDPSSSGQFLGSFIESYAEGNWTPTSTGTSMQFWVTPSGTIAPVNVVSFINSGRVELDRYTDPSFDDGIPLNLLGYGKSSARQIDKHPIDGSGTTGQILGINPAGDGLAWIDVDTLTAAPEIVTQSTAPTETEFLFRDNTTTDTLPKLYDARTQSYRPVELQFQVDSVGEILTKKFPLGARIVVKGTGAEYLVQSGAVSGYTTDSVAVVPTDSMYAVLQATKEGFVKSDNFASNANSAFLFCEKTLQPLFVVDSISMNSDYTVALFDVKIQKGGEVNTNGNDLTIGSTSTANIITFEAGSYKVFSDTIGVRFNIGSVGRINVMWWGAISDVTGISGPIAPPANISYASYTDNSKFFDAAIRSVIYSDVAVEIYVPPGKNSTAYRITRPIQLGDDNTFFGSISVSGDDYSGNFNPKSQILADFSNGPALNIQGARGVYVKNLGLYGKNGTNINSANNSGTPSITEYEGIFGAFSDGADCYTGIAVDNEDATQLRTSSNVFIGRCAIMGFNCGIYLSPTSGLQGDLIRIEDNYLYANTVGIGMQGDQIRDCVLENNAITRGHTGISNAFGVAQGQSFPLISGGWIIQHYQMFNLNTNTCGTSNITGLYSELNGRIGSFRSSNNVPCTAISFNDCNFRDVMADPWRDSIYAVIESNTPLYFNGGTINLNNDDYMYVQVDFQKIIFEGTSFHVAGNAPVNQPFEVLSNSSRLIEINNAKILRKGSSSTYYINTHPNFNQTADLRYANTTELVDIYNVDNAFINPITTNPDIFKKTYRIDFQRFQSETRSLNFTGTNIWDNGRYKFTLNTASCCTLNKLFEGDFIRGINSGDTKGLVPRLRVDSISGNDYWCTKLDPFMVEGTLSSLGIVEKRFMFVGVDQVYGKTTAGSVYLTSMTNESTFKVGDFIFGENIRTGNTRVVEVRTDTIVMSRPATATNSYVTFHKTVVPYLHSSAWNTIEKRTVTANADTVKVYTLIANEVIGVSDTDISSSGDSATVAAEISGLNSRISTLEANIAEGNVSTTTDGSGQVTVAHGLGITPSSAFIQVEGGTWYRTITARDGTNITVTFIDTTTGLAAASTAVQFNWAAHK